MYSDYIRMTRVLTLCLNESMTDKGFEIHTCRSEWELVGGVLLLYYTCFLNKWEIVGNVQ